MISCDESQPKCLSISSAAPAGFFTPSHNIYTMMISKATFSPNNG